MTTSNYATTPATPDEAFLTSAKTRAETVLEKVAGTFGDLRENLREFAILVMDVRQSYVVRRVSLKSGTIYVRDLDGKSKSYRAWYDEELTPLIESVIVQPEERRLFAQNLRNYVQNERVSRCKADPALAREAKHLGLSMSAKAQTSAAKKRAAKPSDTDEASGSVNETALNEGSLRDSAQAVALVCRILSEKVKTTEKLAKGERTAVMSHVESAIKSLAEAHKALKDETPGASIEAEKSTEPVAA